MNRIVVLMVVLFLSSALQAQKQVYDYFKAINEIQYIHPDSAWQLCNQVEKLIVKQKSPYKQAYDLNCFRGNILWFKGDFEKAIVSYKKSLKLSVDRKDRYKESRSLSDIGYVFSDYGRNDSAVYYLIKAEKIADKIHDPGLSAQIKMFTADNYYMMGNFRQALANYRDLLKFYTGKGKKYDIAAMYSNIALSYTKLNKADSAEINFRKAIDRFKALDMPAALGENYLNYSDIFHQKKDLGNALYYTRLAKENFILADSKSNLASAITSEAFYLSELHQYRQAETLYLEALTIARESRSLHLLREIYAGLSDCYNKLGDFQQAFSYQEKYYTTKDSITNERNSRMVEEIRTKYRTEKKEKENTVLKHSNDAKALELKYNKVWLSALGLLILLILISGGIAYSRVKLRQKLILSEKEKNENLYREQLTNLELMALRAQMNPHFIFNCLNSIQNCIDRDDKQAADTYLSKFAVLLRLILETSKNPYLSIADELKLLTLYLEMEQLRFNHKFNFSFSIDPEIDIRNIEIPNMLLQPFFENAIKHGFAMVENDGFIEMEMKLHDEENLSVSITDNGIGINQSMSNKSKRSPHHQSSGLKNISDRLRILNQEEAEHTAVKVTDLSETQKTSGTRIELYIPI